MMNADQVKIVAVRTVQHRAETQGMVISLEQDIDTPDRKVTVRHWVNWSNPATIHHIDMIDR